MRRIDVKRHICTAIVLISIGGGLFGTTGAWAAGTISGTVIENVENAHGIGVALSSASGVLIDLTSSSGPGMSTQSANGAFTFAGLAAGEYLVTAHDRQGRTTTATVSVANGLTTTANVILIPRKEAGVFIYFAAFGVEPGRPGNADVNGDGIVNNGDLAAVTQGVGQSAEENLLDVNRDGIIDQKDIDLVKGAFGKVVVTIGSHYQAEVTPGGSIAVIGDGAASVQSESGTSTGIVDWAPAVLSTSAAANRHDPGSVTKAAAARPVNRNKVRFQITEDVGIAVSPEVGPFSFSHNPDDLTWIDVSLKTGRVTGGRIGLTLSGGDFGPPVNIAGNVADGVVAFAPGGFALYHLVNVSGILPENFPMFAGEAFVMEKGEPAKEDKECDYVLAQNVPCKQPVTGAPGTCTLGHKCRRENADCVLGGECNKCVTQCAAGGGCSCWCLP